MAVDINVYEKNNIYIYTNIYTDIYIYIKLYYIYYILYILYIYIYIYILCIVYVFEHKTDELPLHDIQSVNPVGTFLYTCMSPPPHPHHGHDQHQRHPWRHPWKMPCTRASVLKCHAKTCMSHEATWKCASNPCVH